MTTEDPLEKHFLEAKLPLMEDINRLPDRAAGIVAAAIIDDRLTVAIKSRLAADSGISEQLFGPRGRLGDFGLKIDVGMLLGLYDKGHRDALHAIREVRNKFAHAPGPVSFDMEGLEKFIGKLAFVESFVRRSKPFSSRDHFLSASKYFLGFMVATATDGPPKFNPPPFPVLYRKPDSSRDKRVPQSTPPVHRPNPLRRERRRRRKSSQE